MPASEEEKEAGVLTKPNASGMLHSGKSVLTDDNTSEADDNFTLIPQQGKYQDFIYDFEKLRAKNLKPETMWSHFQFCYLFPQNYEFCKEDVIHLWMAESMPEYISILDGDVMLEDIGRLYFQEFENMDIIEMSHLDSSTGQQWYKLNQTAFDFLQHRHRAEYSRLDDCQDGSWENISYFSFGESSFSMPILKNLYQAKRLCTLLILHEHWSQIHQIPGSFFENFPLLRILDLSYTKITDLSSSIGNLKELRYLNLSGTSIKILPYSVCNLLQLQILKLRGCSKLASLPRDVRKLQSLVSLDVDVACLLASMPAGFGALTMLQTLPAFVVGKEDGCLISELKYMLSLGGTLRILRLENVSSSQEAIEAALETKKYLHKLEFSWTQFQDGSEILESLQPYRNLKELKIVGYGGVKFPNWIGDPLFSKLVTIILDNCRNCEVLPRLGKLPRLRCLCINDMQEVKTIDSQFCDRDVASGLKRIFSKAVARGFKYENTTRAFPRLEKLTLNEMPSLQKWTGISEGDFSRLRKLKISSCPKLIALPKLSLVHSLQQIEILSCPLLLSLSNEGLPTSLQSLVVIDCPSLKEWCSQQDWGRRLPIPDVWIDYQQISRGQPSPTTGNFTQRNTTSIEKLSSPNMGEEKGAKDASVESREDPKGNMVEYLIRKVQLQEAELQRTLKQLEEAIASVNEETAEYKAAKEMIESLAQKNTRRRLPIGEVQKEQKPSHTLDLDETNNLDLSNVKENSSNHDMTSHHKEIRNWAKATELEPDEWIEKYEPGVYITFRALLGGGNDLKRVRFSRKRYSGRQAEKWWAENRERVYEMYNVRVADKSNIMGESEGLLHR